MRKGAINPLPPQSDTRTPEIDTRNGAQPHAHVTRNGGRGGGAGPASQLTSERDTKRNTERESEAKSSGAREKERSKGLIKAHAMFAEPGAPNRAKPASLF